MPERFHLVLLIHAHQPVGNFGHVLERAYKDSYLPFIELLEKHPGVHMGLHYSGPLLTWIEEHRPEYFTRLKALVRSGQVELIGGGFYEPILVSIPPEDQREQIIRLAGYLEKHFGRRPTGAWIAERVWEPQLPSALAAANVGYTLVDDIHFLSAGFEPEELFGAYIAEDRGQSVWLFPGKKALRYFIPFGKVEEVITYLRDAAAVHPSGMASMGDDMEKFGVWPGTNAHCYKDGWLEDFFAALEKNSSWLRVSTPGEYLADHSPLGRADLPTASYTEMMEWVLPTRVRQRYHAVQKEFSARPEILSFLRGGSWRGFFRKYAESNLLHKKMLRVSARIAAVPIRHSSSKASDELVQARDMLLRAQCNDAYWHGIFGGLYAPHLRTELWRNLIRAEAIADRQSAATLIPHVELLDYDADGAHEHLFTATEYQALLKPTDGGTIAAFDFRPAAATLINSIQRRPEAYHARLREAAKTAVAGGVASIHEQTLVKEPGLERFLRYDRWPRHAFRVLLFDPARKPSEYETLELQEDPGFAGGAFQVKSSSANDAQLIREDELKFAAKAGALAPRLSVAKRFSFGPAPNGCEVGCEIGLKLKTSLAKPIAVGIESIINLLAPGEPDRFFETPNGPQNLRFNGTLPGPLLRMEDGWQRIRITLHAPGAKEFWVAPIETVSESEEGFERVYQGSQILAIWHPPLVAEEPWFARLVWRIESF
ncbi:MAG TPA: alpha-amylase/4-alpha-glucanotransferase domain-containing protein [Verrucomicrobiae bacterium]|jgi:4-alpha-glucanotransferase|nr:alpha-amylase/4-alpha-glucanotransferase domain-containing protein [Verrucomicrobiae bacterium]